MLTIRPLTPVDFPAYDSYTAGSFYHQRAWLDLLQATYGYQPLILTAYRGAELVGVLPLMRVHGRLKGRRLVSLPFSHALPFLAQDAPTQNALLDEALALGRREGYAYVEIRPKIALNHPHYQPATLNQISVLPLTGQSPETLFAAFSSSNRRNIRLAEKAGFHLRRGVTAAALRAFHQLEVDTRHRQGSPVYPSRFFPRMGEALGSQLDLWLVAYEGRDVAGLLMMTRGDEAIYGYGAWRKEEALKRLYPMNLLVWEAIQTAHAKGCAAFDFGTTPLHNEGLLEFKARYAPQTRPLPYFYALITRASVPIIQRDGGTVRLAEKVLRRLPRPFFAQLSPLLLREVG